MKIIENCGRSVIQVLIVKVNIGVVSYEAITFQWCWSVVQVKSSDL